MLTSNANLFLGDGLSNLFLRGVHTLQVDAGNHLCASQWALESCMVHHHISHLAARMAQLLVPTHSKTFGHMQSTWLYSTQICMAPAPSTVLPS